MRSGSDEITCLGAIASPPTSTSATPSPPSSQRLDRRPQAHLAPERLDPIRHRLPHLAGPEARVVELLDQALHPVAAIAEEGRAHRARERQPLDPLRRPLGADLAGRHTPDLLGVGAEEELEQAPAEAVRDPLLEGVLRAPRPRERAHVGGGRTAQLDRAELAHHVGAAQGVVEEAPVPVDARHPRAQQELVAQHLVPERLHLAALREEAVAAEVEAVAAPLDGLREPADLVLGLHHQHGLAGLGEHGSRR